MKLAIADVNGEALGLAIELTRKGHVVYHTSRAGHAHHVGSGLVLKAPSLLAVLPDSVGIEAYYVASGGLAAHGQLLRQRGKLVIGGNAWVDKLESKSFARSIADSCGIKTPHEVVYPHVSFALDAVRADPRKYVITVGANRICSDIQDLLVNHLLRLSPEHSPITVSEFIPGTEVYIETWYRSGKAEFTMTAVENRRFLDGDMGVEGEPQTCVAWVNQAREPRVYQSVMKKLDILVEKANYTGPIGARVIISERDKKPYLLGFRAGSPRHINACRSALGFDLVDFLDGATPKEKWYAYSVAVSVPPYPFSPSSIARGLAVIGGSKMYPNDVEADPTRDGEFVCAGASGLIGDVVSVSESIELARQECVRKLDDIIVEGKQARRGGGAARLSRCVSRLSALGYEIPRTRKEQSDEPRAQAI